MSLLRFRQAHIDDPEPEGYKTPPGLCTMWGRSKRCLGPTKRAVTSKRHIGATTQDFWATFGLGDDDKYFGMTDESGVALAAKNRFIVTVG